MNNSIYIQICALIYCLLLIIVYFSKKQYKSFENNIYSYLIIINFVGLIIDITLGIVSTQYEKLLVITTVLTKLYLVYFVVWISVFTYYVIIVSSYKSNENNKIYFSEKGKGIKKSTLYLMFTIALIIIYLLPVNFLRTETGIHSYGSSTILAYILSGISIMTCIIAMLKNIKKEKLKKYSPVLIFLFMGSIVAIIQFVNPTLILIPATETFITFLMYFTIENPDVKLLEEIHKSKEISDNANEEKSIFLYNISQEIRKTTNQINNDAEEIIDSKFIDNNKDLARNIQSTTASLITSTNELFDVSLIDSSNIKVYERKYNLKIVLKEIITKFEKIIQSNDIEFRTNIEHNLPDQLYGDSINLKQVISIILEKCIKYTKQGYIELNVNTIIKNDVCRLIISIEDSGMGIKSEELNKALINNNELSTANKTVTLMNGTMIITSEYGRGTKTKIVLDQKMETKIRDGIKRYSELYDNKKILLIQNNEPGIKIIEKLLKNNKIVLTICKTGKQCLDRIRNKEKYDLILIDENQESLSKEEIVNKLYKISSFKIPIILLTSDNNYEFSSKLEEIGISDFILKPIDKDKFYSKLNIYLNKDN